MAVFATGQGDPLLMLHGIISDASFFDEAATKLAGSYRVITYDRRGYGASDKPADGDYTVAAQADDAAAVLQEHASAPAWVFGNSAGGLIAVELCLRHPQLVRGLVLLEPSLVVDPDSKAQIAAWNAELNGYVESNRIKRALPAFARVVGDPSGGKGASSLAQMRAVFANLDNFMHGELNEVQRYAPSPQVLAGIQVPVCVLVTKQGRDGMFGQTSRSGAEALGWPIAYVEGYHNAARDNAPAFAATLTQVLEGMR